MSDRDNEKKSSWLSNQAPAQRKPVGDEYGGVGKRSTTENLVNPQVPTSESWLVQRRRAEQGAVKQRATEDVQRAHSDAGAPLPENVRERFEASLGTDLAGVRVHTGAASEGAAAAVGAKAYTTGQDIHFAAGTYDPTTKSGQQLLAHEVAHTVQQSGTSGGAAQFKLNVSHPGDEHEHEADRAADAMLAGERASVAKGSVSGVLARQSADEVCVGPDAPLVCAPVSPTAADVWSSASTAPQSSQSSQSAQPQQSVAPAQAPDHVAAPAPFDIPVAEQCMLPPPPRDWSQTPAAGECPMEALVGGPGYKPEYVASNLDTYKSAFNTSWSELQGGYNAVVELNRSYKLKEKEVIPLLHVGDGVVVSGAGQNATQSFSGDKLKPETAKVSSEKVNAKPGLREQLLAAKDKIESSQRAVNIQVMTGEQANGDFLKACLAVDTAANNVTLVNIEHQIADAQLDKEQVKRELENYKADIKATVETAKMASALWSAWANPTKIFDAVNQTMNAGGALAERDVTRDANKKLEAIDGKIRGFQNHKFGLLLKNAQNSLSSALVDMRNKLIDLRKASEILKDRKQDYERAYRDMAGLMAQAGTASGMKSKDAKALAAAVEALPKIEAITQQLQGMDAGVTVPKYNVDSGIGAAMCSNLSAFTHALSVVKGNKDYINELKAIWEGRKASVQMVIDKALTVEGAEW